MPPVVEGRSLTVSGRGGTVSARFTPAREADFQPHDVNAAWRSIGGSDADLPEDHDRVRLLG
jgi:hypothetical protein